MNGFIVFQTYGNTIANCDGRFFKPVGFSSVNNVWIHYAVVIDGNEQRWYRNGELYNTQPRIAYETPFTSAGILTVFVGNIDQNDNAIAYTDDFRVYNRSLTESEIVKLYNYRGVL